MGLRETFSEPTELMNTAVFIMSAQRRVGFSTPRCGTDSAREGAMD
jgi:hypothetical protein